MTPKPTDASLARAREIVGGCREKADIDRSAWCSYEDILADAFAAALDAQASNLRDLRLERDVYKKAAESWMADWNKLKVKYEPLVGVTSQASSPHVVVSDSEIEAEWDTYRQTTLAASSTVSIRKVWHASARWMRERLGGKDGK